MLPPVHEDRHRRGTQEPPALDEADRPSSGIRFKVKVEEDLVEVEGGFRTDYKVTACLKLYSVSMPPRNDDLPAVPVYRYARLVDEGRRDEACIMGLLVADVKRLDNQARFVLEVAGKVIVLANRPQSEVMATLRERGYDPDPLIVWAQERQASLRRQQVEERRESNGSVEEEDLDDTILFSYLLDLSLRDLTRGGRAKLTSERDRKYNQLMVLCQVWRESNSLLSLDATSGQRLERYERPSDNGPTSTDSRERTPRSTVGIPSTSGSTAVHEVERNRYGNAATRGGNHSRIVNEEMADESGHTATVIQSHQAVSRNRLGKRVHPSSDRNTQQHHAVAEGSHQGDRRGRPTAVSTRSNGSPAGTSRQDHQ